MIWLYDGVTPWLWIAANLLIATAYIVVLARGLERLLLHTGFDGKHAGKVRSFIYHCGIGHLVMAAFMGGLAHSGVGREAWYLLVAVDAWTAFVSVRLALLIRELQRRD